MPLFTTIRFKMLCVVVVLTALLGLAVFLVGNDIYESYREMRVAQCRALVEGETEQVEDAILLLQANARALALLGTVLYQAAGPHVPVQGGYAVSRNFQVNTLAVGGGIWYRPYLFGHDRERACFYAFSRDGEVFFDESFAGPDYHYPTQVWYRSIKAQLDARGTGPGPDVAWTPPYVDATGTQALMTTVGSGMYAPGGEFLGLSTVDWRLDDIARRMGEIRPTPGSVILFADTVHDLIVTLVDPALPQNRLTGESPQSLSWYDAGAPSERALLHNGVPCLSFARKLSNGMTVIVNVPENELFSDINSALRATLFTLAGAMLLIALVTWALLDRFINKPVAALSAAAAAVGAGDLDLEIPLRSRDELGMLARAFSGMTRSLKSHIGHLETVTAEKERIATELSIARDIQAAMLPSIFPPFPERRECDIRAVMLPAKEVGGDFYDFFFVDENQLAVVVADVSDKGVPAALVMVIAKTLLRNSALAGADPGKVLAAVNARLCENNSTGMFVTASLGVLDVRTGLFRYANAGHNPFFAKKPGRAFERVALKPGLPLGVMETMTFLTEQRMLEPGCSLFFYTDGVTEATDAENGFFGEDGLLRALGGLDNRLPGDLQGFIEGLRQALDAFARGARQSDDITMLALAYLGPGNENRREGDGARAMAPGAALPMPPLAPLAPLAPPDDGGAAETERRFPAAVAAVPAFMDWVEEALAQAGVTERRRMRFAVAAEEMFANIVNHAYTDDSAPGPVTARLAFAGDPPEFSLQLIDAGRAFNPLEQEAPDLALPAEERAPGGLGIFLARNNTDAMRYERRDGKNILTMLLKSEPEASS